VYAYALQFADMLVSMMTRSLYREIPPTDIAEELKDLFVQINIDKYFARRGLAFDEAKFQSFMG
jgi:hypothetical protein